MPAVGFLWLSDVSLPLFLVLGSCCDPRSQYLGWSHQTRWNVAALYNYWIWLFGAGGPTYQNIQNQKDSKGTSRDVMLTGPTLPLQWPAAKIPQQARYDKHDDQENCRAQHVVCHPKGESRVDSPQQTHHANYNAGSHEVHKPITVRSCSPRPAKSAPASRTLWRENDS